MIYLTERLLQFQKLAPGIVKVKYHHDDDWDLYLDLSHFQKPVDMSLVLPHYRAYRQPVEHRMSMFIASHSEQTKLKICRPVSSSRFYLELRASTSNITVWLPSDFKGQIRHTGKAVFSSGFVNRIMRNVQINNHVEYESPMHDSVFVYTTGQVTFRMWDVRTRAPEIPHKEAIKRVFGCTRRAPETAIDWDFLLED
ncbi:hypothetical protein AMATHDRAFT_140011 [Amanita thiersii Skay4041]|uniref:DUF7330 domain-containing protein n=1 Tax=Amanita thiersii Skay4041 TaxID=703135 RepID=A0A2A9NNB0_9AGAR|nr:hypothetical protein AMATHDRAFT_140011 [Amanita thiersii Skay4041]